MVGESGDAVRDRGGHVARAIGARLGGAIAKAVGSAAPAGRVRARFEGSAGQSFGAFLAKGVTLAHVVF
jgi:glutamate synthase domain-containing protein 3